MKLSTRGFVLRGFDGVLMRTTATAIVLVIPGSRAAPHKKSGDAQHDHQGSYIRPTHAANITAIRRRANGIFRVLPRPARTTLPADMAEPFRHHHRVSYAECTVGDHIYHSRYLDLLEAARGEFMRARGQTVLALQEADYIFPVIEAQLRYKFPARYDDLLTIEVWLTRLERVRLNFGHRILNANGKLILEAETFHCCTGRDEKPKRLPPEFVETLTPYLLPA